MNFKLAQLESYCKNPSPEVKCIVLFGNNEGAISIWQKKCAEAVCGSVSDAFRYVGLEMENVSKDGGEIYAEYNAQSLMGGRRAVVVKNADNNLAAVLKAMLPETKSENLLILSSTSLNTRSSLITWAKERKDVIIVGCYEERDTDIQESAAQMLAQKGIRLDAASMQVLCSRLSPDRKINQNEIDKLAMFLADKKTATVDDIKKVVSDVAGANFEDLCYYTAGGDVQRASAMFVRLLNEGEEPATLVRQISYHFSKLLDCVVAAESGSSLEDSLKNLRPPLMFYRKNDFIKQLKMWNKERLLGALKMLYDCERDCKTTGMPAEQCASYMIMRLAGAAQKLMRIR